MLTRSKISLPAETPVSGGGDATAFACEKLKENEERKKNLGSLQPSLDHSSDCPRYFKKIKLSSFVNPPSSAKSCRRSSRLQNVAPKNYSETGAEEDENALSAANTSEEDEKLLGNCEVGCDLLADSGGCQTTSAYEKSRIDRIKENNERMKSLGILNLTSECLRYSRMKSVRPRKTIPLAIKNLPSPAKPARRSSRLQSVTPINYNEVQAKKDDKPLADDCSNWLDEGQREEVYTEEHEKLLGSCEMDWVLFVDGYDSNGKRIYDQVKGKTCHQCRQKTLGHHTSCIKCNLVQGQFCGDCLYMRYGENVLEVKKNHSWICPVCRGICNCSLCRVKKGWVPTGSLYRRVQRLGYKSVAHFLILTRRGNSSDSEPIDPDSPKKPQISTDAKLSVKHETFTTDEDEDEYNDSIKNMALDPNSLKKPQSLTDTELAVKAETFTTDAGEEEDNKCIKQMVIYPNYLKKKQSSADAELVVKFETFATSKDENSIKNMELAVLALPCSAVKSAQSSAVSELAVKPDTFAIDGDEEEDNKGIKNMEPDPDSMKKPQSSTNAELYVKPESFAKDEDEVEGINSIMNMEPDPNSQKKRPSTTNTKVAVKPEAFTAEEDKAEENNGIKNMELIGNLIISNIGTGKQDDTVLKSAPVASY